MFIKKISLICVASFLIYISFACADTDRIIDFNVQPGGKSYSVDIQMVFSYFIYVHFRMELNVDLLTNVKVALTK